MTIIRSLSALHPICEWRARELEKELVALYESGATKFLFKPFETFRLYSRQDELFAKKATKARAWESAHQFGLAVDFAVWLDGGWSWTEAADWALLESRAQKHGLTVPIEWDRGHVQHPLWPKWRQLERQGWSVKQPRPA